MAMPAKRGFLRPNGHSSRAPMFVVIGLLLVCFLLVYNYMGASTRSRQLQDQLEILHRKMRDCELRARELNSKNEAVSSKNRALSTSVAEAERKQKEAEEKLSTLTSTQEREADTLRAVREQLSQNQEGLGAMKLQRDDCMRNQTVVLSDLSSLERRLKESENKLQQQAVSNLADNRHKQEDPLAVEAKNGNLRPTFAAVAPSSTRPPLDLNQLGKNRFPNDRPNEAQEKRKNNQNDWNKPKDGSQSFFGQGNRGILTPGPTVKDLFGLTNERKRASTTVVPQRYKGILEDSAAAGGRKLPSGFGTLRNDSAVAKSKNLSSVKDRRDGMGMDHAFRNQNASKNLDDNVQRPYPGVLDVVTKNLMIPVTTGSSLVNRPDTGKEKDGVIPAPGKPEKYDQHNLQDPLGNVERGEVVVNHMSGDENKPDSPPVGIIPKKEGDLVGVKTLNKIPQMQAPKGLYTYNVIVMGFGHKSCQASWVGKLLSGLANSQTGQQLS